MAEIESYNKFIKNIFQRAGLGAADYDITDKETNTQTHILYMLNRTQSIFEWLNLPETIPQRVLELYLQIRGNCAFYEHEGELYVFTGGLGGEPDQYYMPTIYTIANPYFNISKNLKIDTDCIVVPNDSLYIGLIPLFARYASQMTENELSLYVATINARIVELITATDERTRKAAEKFLDDITAGKLGVIGTTEFFEGVKTQPYGSTGNTNTITNLIEYEQYLKASWFNEIGLNANYNMKRESLNSAESQLNNDALLPLIDDMLKQRQIGADKVNAMFGTHISVKLSSSWEDNIQEIDIEHGEQITDNEPENGGDDNE